MLKEIIFTLLVACVVGFPQVPRPSELAERESRIVGGRDASIEEFPFIVALLLWNNFNCGGTILNANTIVSAAHCTENRVPADFQIRAGSNRVGTGGQLVPVTRIIVHESYRNGQPTHDIVIFKLSRNLVFSATVRAALLPVQGFAVPAGSTALLSGWGGINTAGDRSPTVLQALNTPIMGNAACQTRIQFPVRADQLCAGGVVGRDACYGDSGGPLTFQGRFVGIVSFGPGRDCAVGWPIVYTRVSEFLPFIVRNM